jgi:hypothetical protein
MDSCSITRNKNSMSDKPTDKNKPETCEQSLTRLLESFHSQRRTAEAHFLVAERRVGELKSQLNAIDGAIAATQQAIETVKGMGCENSCNSG